MLQRDVVDQFLDEDGLAGSGSTEEPDLAAFHERRDQVDDLDPGLEGLHLRREVTEARRVTMDRPPLDAFGYRPSFVDRFADHVPEASERRRADGNGDRRARVHARRATRQAVGRVHGHGANAVVAEVLLHLRDQRPGRVAFGDVDLEGGVDLREPVGEDGVDDDALDLDDSACVRGVFRCRTCVSSKGSPAHSVTGAGGPQLYRSARRARTVGCLHGDSESQPERNTTLAILARRGIEMELVPSSPVWPSPRSSPPSFWGGRSLVAASRARKPTIRRRS